MTDPELLEIQLVKALKKLEVATDHVMKTRGYSGDAKKMKLLMELIKEQIRNENSLSTTGAIR